MYLEIAASDIKRNHNLQVQPGKNCCIYINDTQKIKMVYLTVRGASTGAVWFFICPLTGKRCRKLYFINGMYCHTSIVSGYYRKRRPDWFSETPFYKKMKLKQRSIDAERTLAKRFFKSHYAGKPTKKYIKCLTQIEEAAGITMLDIINGIYE